MSLSLQFKPLPTLHACYSVPIEWTYSGNTTAQQGQIKLVFVSAQASVSRLFAVLGCFADGFHVVVDDDGGGFESEYGFNLSCRFPVSNIPHKYINRISSIYTHHLAFLLVNPSSRSHNSRTTSTLTHTIHQNRHLRTHKLQLGRMVSYRPTIRNV